MNVEVLTDDVKLSPRQRADVVARARAAFGRLAHRVERVVVRLRSPSGRTRDTECLVQVQMAGEPPVVVGDRHTNLQSVLRRALHRAWRAAALRILMLQRSRKTLMLGHKRMTPA